jgi:hypothetical protein
LGAQVAGRADGTTKAIAGAGRLGGRELPRGVARRRDVRAHRIAEEC